MTNIDPTVGRMVYYHALGSADGKFPVGESRAAVITAVNYKVAEDGGVPVVESVSLCILNPTGMYFNQSVQQGEGAGQWDWMPFQKDQAARLAPGTPVQQPGGKPDEIKN